MLPIQLTSRLIADVGLGFGDEGKGRVVCELTNEINEAVGRNHAVGLIVKINGGANSGHTAAGLKLNLLPCGVALPSVPWLGLAPGVVADPLKLEWESRMVEACGLNVRDRLVVDERCMVSDVTHRLLDLAWENYRQNQAGQAFRGSTGRGITPAFSDEVNQWVIHYSTFLGNKDHFARNMALRIKRASDMIRHVCKVTEADWYGFFDTLTQAERCANAASLEKGLISAEEVDFHSFKGSDAFSLNPEAIIERYWEEGIRWKDRILDLREIALDCLQREQFIIGEFGQAWWLDKRQGFSPNVTASHTYTAEIFPSLGIPFQPVHVVGCLKAYDTKVGTHAFLTEFPEDHPLGNRLKTLEFGTSTGRQRMVGWFDAVEKGTALRYGGANEIVINKLDALTLNSPDEGPLKICVAYVDSDGKRYYTVPRNDSLRQSLRPEYIEFQGWNEDISGIRRYEDLPEGAKEYIEGVIDAMQTCAGAGDPSKAPRPKLRYIGVGPDPDQIIKI